MRRSASAPWAAQQQGFVVEVRSVEPEAYLLYKPHPDVVAGLCRAGAGEDDAAALCDEVLPQGSIQQLFTQIDAVHVLTSLAGFEALLRGLEVHCWGYPSMPAGASPRIASVAVVDSVGCRWMSWFMPP